MEENLPALFPAALLMLKMAVHQSYRLSLSSHLSFILSNFIAKSLHLKHLTYLSGNYKLLIEINCYPIVHIVFFISAIIVIRFCEWQEYFLILDME